MSNICRDALRCVSTENWIVVVGLNGFGYAGKSLKENSLGTLIGFISIIGEKTGWEERCTYLPAA